MAITFDPANKLIILDSGNVTASEIWSRWIDWTALSDNNKYLPACSQVGGDSLGSGLFIPIYIFLLNGWRVRPMEANHYLIITGNLFVDGGGVPVVQTAGAFNVSTQFTVPVQAQAVSTSGASPSDISNAVWGHSSALMVIADLSFIKGIEGGRWKIIANQMIFYNVDNATEIARFDLKDSNGFATMDNPMERVRV